MNIQAYIEDLVKRLKDRGFVVEDTYYVNRKGEIVSITLKIVGRTD